MNVRSAQFNAAAAAALLRLHERRITLEERRRELRWYQWPTSLRLRLGRASNNVSLALWRTRVRGGIAIGNALLLICVGAGAYASGQMYFAWRVWLNRRDDNYREMNHGIVEAVRLIQQGEAGTPRF